MLFPHSRSCPSPRKILDVTTRAATINVSHYILLKDKLLPQIPQRICLQILVFAINCLR